MECISKRLGVYHQLYSSGELEPDNLEKIARTTWPDGQDPRWVCFGIQRHDGDGVLEGVIEASSIPWRRAEGWISTPGIL